MSTSENWYAHLVVPSFTRALWVVGPTKCGKSTWAKDFGKANNIELIEAGKWARELMPETATVAEITANAVSVLKKDMRYSSRIIEQYLTATEILRKPIIIVGSRNPTDFVDNFDPKRDGVVFLNTDVYQFPTQFETVGIGAIKAYVRFLKFNEIMDNDHCSSAEPIKVLERVI